jgi:hypothetical protein
MLSTASAARRRRLQQLAAHPHTPGQTRQRIEQALVRVQQPAR